MTQQPGAEDIDRLYDEARSAFSSDAAVMDRMYDEAREAHRLGFGGHVRELGQAAVSGAASFPGEALRGIGVSTGMDSVKAAGEWISESAPEVDARVAQTVPGRIASGIGQVGAMGATALVSAPLALGGAVLGGVSDMDRRLADADLDTGERALYLIAGGGAAALEMVPIAGMFARLNKVSGGAATSALRKTVEASTLRASAVNVAESMALEGATEQAQAELVNALVAHATDEDFQAFQDWREGVAGGGVGAIVATAIEIATLQRRAMGARRERVARDVQQQAEQQAFDGYLLEYGDAEADASLAILQSQDQPGTEIVPREGQPDANGATEIVPLGATAPSGATGAITIGEWVDTEAPAAPAAPGRQTVSSAAPTQEVRVAPMPLRDPESWRKVFQRVAKWTETQLASKRKEVLALEGQVLREQYPDRADDWYARVATLREAARNPLGGQAAQDAAAELRRFEVRPIAAAIPVEMLDAILRLRSRSRYRDPSPSAVVAEAGATAGTTEFAQQGQQSPAASPASQPSAPLPPGVEGARSVGGPSSARNTPVPRQSGPQGQPVFEITGTSDIAAWGGTRENVIGARTPVSRSDVASSLVSVAEFLGVRVERMANDLGVPVLGVYRPGGVVQVSPENIPEFAHEIGHAIHRVLMQRQRSGAAVSADWDSALTGLPAVVQGDLRKLGAVQATGQPGRELTEGMGELVRMWVQAPEQLTAEAPQAKAWFEGWLIQQPAKLQRALTEAQSRAHVYRFQGLAMRSQIARTPTVFQQIITRLRFLPDAARIIYDEAYAADAWDRRMDEMGKSGNISLRDMFRAGRGIARGLTYNALHGRMSDFSGRAIQQENYDAILKRLGKSEFAAMGDYLHARATLVHEAGNPGYDTGMTPIEAADKIELYNREKPHFAGIADSLQQWMGAINGILAQYSPTYAAEMGRIQASDAAKGIDFYIPLRRAFEARAGGASKRMLVESGGVSKRRTESGSSRPIVNPLETLANEARVRFERAVLRNALETMVSLHDAALEGGQTESGASPWIREIRADEIGGVAYDPAGNDGFDALADVLAGPKLTGERVFVQVRDATGRRRTFSMDPKIAALAVTVDPLTLRQGMGWFGKILSWGRRGFVAGTISYNPVFQFYTNLLYDVPTAYLVGKYVKPLDLFGLVASTASNTVQGALHVTHLRRSKWEGVYADLGLKSSDSTSSEFAVGRTVRNVHGRTHVIANLWDALGVALSVPQRAVQITLMQKAAKARGIDINNLDVEGAMILRLAARQPVDYTAGSQTSRRWQTSIPFLRAALEGQKQIAEAAKRNPVEFLVKVGMLSAVYTAARYAFGDDELEASKSTEERLRSISIPLGDDPDSEVIQWRIPNELVPLTIGPGLIIDAMRGQGQDPSEVGLAALMAILPPTPADNPVLNTILQQMSNKQRPLKPQGSEGGGAPIVPAALEGLEPLAQSGPTTAPIAVKLAQAVGLALGHLPPTHGLRQQWESPVRMEAMIRSMLGGNVVTVLEGWGMVPGLATEREYERAERFAGMYRRGGMTSWDDPNIRLIYELDAQAEMAARTRDGTTFEDPLTQLRRQSIAETAAALQTMRWLSTHEAEGMTVAGRRALARQAQILARQAAKEIREGGITTAYQSAADIRVRRQQHDLNRGAYFP